jgi:glycosyltransferase involved in cell wall biosynthesis
LKKVLYITPFSNIYPPQNGGMKRCFNIINQLSKYVQLTVISFQTDEKWVESFSKYPNLKKCSFYFVEDYYENNFFWKHVPKKIKYGMLYRFYTRNLLESANSNYLRFRKAIIKNLKKNNYNEVIFENLSTLKIVDIVRKYSNSKIIYNSHNFDTTLAKKEFNKGLLSKNDFIKIEEIERNLNKYIDEIWLCSKLDQNSFYEVNRDNILYKIVPNGIEITPPPKKHNKKESEFNILFCGSLDYFPNNEGLIWFIDNCWKGILNNISNAKFSIIGSGNPSPELLNRVSNYNLNFIGKVDDVSEYYEKTSIAIVPLLSGSGTRLKILEAFNLGSTIVSTSLGAEGIECENYEHLLIADNSIDFVSKVIELFNSQDLRNELSKNARRLIELKYDWDVIGETFK